MKELQLKRERINKNAAPSEFRFENYLQFCGGLFNIKN